MNSRSGTHSIQKGCCLGGKLQKALWTTLHPLQTPKLRWQASGNWKIKPPLVECNAVIAQNQTHRHQIFQARLYYFFYGELQVPIISFMFQLAMVILSFIVGIIGKLCKLSLVVSVPYDCVTNIGLIGYFLHREHCVHSRLHFLRVRFMF